MSRTDRSFPFSSHRSLPFARKVTQRGSSPSSLSVVGTRKAFNDSMSATMEPLHSARARTHEVGLCLALAFTFPIIMHPIYEIIEMKLMSSGWFQKFSCNTNGERLGLHGARMLVLLIVTIVASCIPGFGVFISLVGSTVSAMLAFALPATFHLLLMGTDLKLWQRAVDYLLLLVGVAFACYGTYDALSDHIMGS